MKLNVDAPAMRRINRATVLHIIRNQRTTSRIDLAQITGLNKATVSYIVDELIEEQWVQEIGYGSSTGGRKPILLRFNANAAYAIGMDLELPFLKTVVCNTRGEVVYKQERMLDALTNADTATAVLDAIMEEVQAAQAAAPKSSHGLVGIGLALPGLINAKTGASHHLRGITESDWDLRAELAERTTLPVFIDNNANCGAWSELLKSASRKENLVYIHAGSSINTGIVIHGELYKGRSGAAGEFGHMTISPMGQRCVCGNYGCWEQYASERSLLQYINEAGGNHAAIDLRRGLMEQILDGAYADNRAYIRALNTLGQHLGIGIANIVNALSPDRISLGGTISQASTFILPEIERVLQYRLIGANKNIPISIASAHAIAVGAATHVMNQTIFLDETVTP
ncbi:ROK family transcriptional regulator [Ferroacidibacillus organovorans]|uniref:Sugar kinase n=1 Tax=Ferroacidibacillus organovorans TaxID=1765683 RepID=A0A853KG18_9BACL|nr:ROK family transcriptional regulator [Ferroacidibacillus organovorans]KYP79316.1 sugar kinase [Ferroacidibacillus organovorans]OAG95238.1 sugar kinase [Ferroacidibacillus organovorans]